MAVLSCRRRCSLFRRRSVVQWSMFGRGCRSFNCLLARVANQFAGRDAWYGGICGLRLCHISRASCSESGPATTSTAAGLRRRTFAFANLAENGKLRFPCARPLLFALAVALAFDLAFADC